MKKIYLILSLISLVLFFSSCGGRSSELDEEDIKDGEDTLKIQVSKCDTYTQIQNGDILIKEIDGTVVTIRDIDSLNKAVCVDTGAAHILINIKE